MKKKFDSNHPENWQPFLKQKRERVQQPLVASKTVFKPKSAEAAWLNERLDLMIADARLVGIPDKFIMSATMDWAAQRTYAAGGI